jgi:hypothetical protein
MTELGWDTRVPDGWASGVAEWDWQDWRGDGDLHLGWRKWGPCPRCGHTMAVYRYAVRTILPVSNVDARCNCQEAHPGRPVEADGGCGPGSDPKVEIPVS